MTVDRISADDFLGELNAALLNRTQAYDTAFGPVLDQSFGPVATVLENHNNERLRPVSLLMSLVNETEFSENDLDGVVFNEGMTRPDGSFAVTSVTFFVSAAPTFDLVVQRGFPIAGSPDQSTGAAVTFVTTEGATMPFASASSYFNPTTNRYELTLPVQSLISGALGRVGPNRITRPLRPLVGFDGVTNLSGVTAGGRNRFTNTELLELFLLAITGRQLSAADGIQFFTRDNFPAAEDVLEVSGTDATLTRGDTDAGAVDCFIKGVQAVSVTDNDLTYLGRGQLVRITTPPLVQVNSVTINGVTAVEGTDYDVVFDTSGYSGSVRGIEGVRVRATPGTAGILNAPVGSPAIIAYECNQLVRDLQARSEQEDVNVDGRDLLYREGAQVDIVLSARLKAKTGFTPSTVASLAQATLIAFVNTSLGLGDQVEQSDLDFEVRRLSGVDNFVFTRLARASVGTGVADVDDILPSEFPNLTTANMQILFS